jgi:hypothetical protein
VVMSDATGEDRLCGVGELRSSSLKSGSHPAILGEPMKKSSDCTGWSKSQCEVLLFRHVLKNDESYWGSPILSLLSV